MIDTDITRNTIAKSMAVRKLEILVDFKKFLFLHGDVGLWEAILMLMSTWETIIIPIGEIFPESDSPSGHSFFIIKGKKDALTCSPHIIKTLVVHDFVCLYTLPFDEVKNYMA